jgi:hypothetical protein
MLRIYSIIDALRAGMERLEALHDRALDRPDGGINRETGEILLTEEEAAEEAAIWREINTLEIAADDRTKAYARICKELVAESKIHKAKEAFHRKRRKAIERRHDELERVIEVQVPDGKKLKDEEVNVYWSQTKPLIPEGLAEQHIDDLPPMLVKVEKEPRKTLLEQAIARGDKGIPEPLQGCLKPRRYIVIR